MKLNPDTNKFPPIDIDKFAMMVQNEHYMAANIINDYQWVAVQKFLFTYGIVYGDNRNYEHGYERRWCYHNASDAIHAMADWMERGWEDKPLNYITEKGTTE